MGRLSKLTALEVQRLKVQGRYGDGGGLWLQISKSGSKSWLFRFMLNKKSREMGIGSVNAISLAEARQMAADCRNLLAKGIDPIEDRNQRYQALTGQQMSNITFDFCVDRFLESMSDQWENEKHRYQWRQSLGAYASPVIGKLPVGSIETNHVEQLLRPIWRTKTETARRLRGRIEAILDYAKVKKWRTGENPAIWKGNLDKLLPKPSKIAPVEHLAALPVYDVPAFSAELRAKESLTARALELQILTVLRPGELVGAKVYEIDLNVGVWTIPGNRMKMRKTHRVPLSSRASEILGELIVDLSSEDYVFRGVKFGHMTTASLLKLAKEMRPGTKITTHGSRSSFRDWCADHTNFQREVIEACLAHQTDDQTEAAYLRTDFYLKRKVLMQKWADYCMEPIAPSAEVVQIGVLLA